MTYLKRPVFHKITLVYSCYIAISSNRDIFGYQRMKLGQKFGQALSKQKFDEKSEKLMPDM